MVIKNLFIMLLLFSTTFARDCATDIANTLATTDVGLYIAIVFALNILVISLTYMIGESFHMPNLTVFAKEEIYHLMFSAALLVGFGGVVALTCSIADNFLKYSYDTLGVVSNCYPANSDAVSLATCYMNKMDSNAEQLLQKYVQKSIDLQMDSTTIVSITLPLLGGSSTGLWAYRRTYSMQYDMVTDTFLVPSLVSIKMQKVFLQFVDQIALQLLLPLGFLLRIFIPTRYAGNFVLGLVLGVYVIFPMLYALNAAMFEIVFPSCSDYSSIIDDHVFGGCGEKGSFWDVAKLIPQAFFLPNLAVAIFITFVSSVGKALRGAG